MLCGLCFRRLVSANFIFGCCYETYKSVWSHRREDNSITYQFILIINSLHERVPAILLSLTVDDAAPEADRKEFDGEGQQRGQESRRRGEQMCLHSVCNQLRRHSRPTIQTSMRLDSESQNVI